MKSITIHFIRLAHVALLAPALTLCAETVSLLDRPDLWPPAASNAAPGLLVTIPPGRGHTIAATHPVPLPVFGRLRVQVTDLGSNATWLVRISGELRERGRAQTIGIAEGETAAGTREFHLDPRSRTRLDAPLCVQLGVVGPPGSSARFLEATLLPPALRTNVTAGVGQPGQVSIPTIELMPNLPAPYVLIDWRAKARAYDRLAFDVTARGEFLPLVWLDESRSGGDPPAFGLPSYVGGQRRAGTQEGVTCLGAVLGASVAGVDKSRQERDYVALCAAWFNTNDQLNLVLNNQHGGTGGSFWYEIFPSVAFSALADRYPDHPRLADIVKITADRWREACLALSDPQGVPDFDHTAFDFRTRKPADNGKWREPDAAAGVAWLEYAAWRRFGDTNHLDAAQACLQFLQNRQRNPYYEVLLPFGALTAARLNAEAGGHYDVDRLLNWCFEPSDTRGGWGVIVGRWGDFDCDGLVGSIDNRGGYAFAMNTFVQAGALVPLVRYDPRYARAIGKWMLNLAHAARLFYPAAMPPGHESGPAWSGDPEHAIAYEGLRYAWQGRTPCATGDPVAMHWGPPTDLGLYGSGYVGLLGGIVSTTDVPAILKLDCLATDFCRGGAFPTFLLFNPYAEARTITLPLGPAACRVYDAVAGRFISGEVRDAVRIEIPADGAVLAVLTPAGGQVESGDGVRINGTVVDFHRHHLR